MLPRFLSISHFLRRGAKDRTNARTSRRSVRLVLEVLEDRSVPSSASGTVSGLVFADPSHIGVYSTADAVLSGIPVSLSGTTTQGTPVSTTATTDLNGSFNFLNVLPGTYQLIGGSTTDFSSESTPAPFTVSAGQTVSENLAYQGGLSAGNISLRDFLTSTTSISFGFSPAGSGQGLANYRPNNAPDVSSAIADQAVPINSSPTMIDLAGHFSDPDITNSQVTFNITNGGVPQKLVVDLFDTTAPQTVANFFDYINSGGYNNATFNRLVSGFVLQGGGLTLNSAGNGLTATPLNPAVPNEFSGVSNTANTLAMALSSGNINSGTDQFFFNLVNNAASLDAQKFTVFGQVSDFISQLTLSNLALTSVKNESSSSAATANPSVDLSSIPLTNYTGTNFPTDAKTNNFMVINNITINKQDEFLTYAVTSSNPSLVTASVKNEWLTLNYAAGQTGSAAITVTATDRYGATVSQTFNVSVNPTAPAITGLTIAPNSTTNTATLTATPTGTDAQGKPITYAYQWFQNGTAISGANAAALTLPAGVQANDQFTVKVTPSDGTLTGTTVTSNPITLATVSPTTLQPPSISSAAIIANSATSTTTLTASPVVSSDPLGQPVTASYQWFQNGTLIPGAASATLTLPTGAGIKVGDLFTVQITPSDGTLTGAVFTSKAVTVASVSPTTLQPPTIQSVIIASNNPANATLLTATVNSQSPALFTYQWERNGTAIAGATTSTFALTAVNVSQSDKFDVKVTPAEGPLAGTAVTSNQITITGVNPITTA